MAYCMLGIFQLNMPLLYGEGSKAFTRLQEEIMKVSDDHSLFCWTWTMSQNRGSFLSEAPSAFKHTDRIVPKQEDKRPAPYTLTNAGLSIRLAVLHCWQSSLIGVLRVATFEKWKDLRPTYVRRSQDWPCKSSAISSGANSSLRWDLRNSRIRRVNFREL
jgi:hypothetical protein